MAFPLSVGNQPPRTRNLRGMALYIHIPYCEAKCHYCDFNSYAGRGREFDAMAEALLVDLDRAISALPDTFPRPLKSVFIGGGTPSVMPGPAVARLLHLARERLGFAPDIEITSEANPGSLDLSWLEAMMGAGLGRLSLGVQSLDDGELRLLGRIHTRQVAEEAVALARRAGIGSLSLDLIFGLPHQTVEGWRRNLEAMLDLEADHLSLYGLIIEEGTPFARQQAEGSLSVPDDDVQARMYDIAHSVASARGYAQYEISSYARPGHRCRHNEMYWRNEAYLGVGPGAVSYIDGWRGTRIRHPSEYMRRVRAGEELLVEAERLSPPEALAETIMLGLRTTDGVDLERLAARFSALVDVRRLEAAARALAGDLVEAGVLKMEGRRLVVERSSLMVSNGVMERFLDLPAHLTKQGPFATFIQTVQQDRFSL